MANEYYYTVDVNWNSGRLGTISSPVLEDTIEVATPPEFANGIPGVWSPEHLLVASVNGCLMATFAGIAENSKLSFISFSSKASGKLEMVDGRYMMSEITLLPVVILEDEKDTAKAMRVLQKAEANCLIANSIKAKIIYCPRVAVETPVAV